MYMSWIWVGWSVALFLGILALLRLGWHVGCQRGGIDPTKSRAGLSIIDGSIYGLLGLLLAFSFSGAASRFDHRRLLIVSEANAIGTAWNRLDLVPPARQEALRQHLREYFDARLAFYEARGDEAAREQQLAAARQRQADLWTDAVAACSATADQRAAMLVLPALNDMFDVATERLNAVVQHPPLIIFVLLFSMLLTCGFLVGHAMSESQTRNRLHAICYAAMMSMAFYVILDFEHPRFGLIRIDVADRALIELRATMK